MDESGIIMPSASASEDLALTCSQSEETSKVELCDKEPQTLIINELSEPGKCLNSQQECLSDKNENKTSSTLTLDGSEPTSNTTSDQNLIIEHEEICIERKEKGPSDSKEVLHKSNTAGVTDNSSDTTVITNGTPSSSKHIESDSLITNIAETCSEDKIALVESVAEAICPTNQVEDCVENEKLALNCECDKSKKVENIDNNPSIDKAIDKSDEILKLNAESKKEYSFENVEDMIEEIKLEAKTHVDEIPPIERKLNMMEENDSFYESSIEKVSTDKTDNNNLPHTDTQVLNRKELLDILEGNDDNSETTIASPSLQNSLGTIIPNSMKIKDLKPKKEKIDPILEHKLALKQLTDLPTTKNRRKTQHKIRNFADVQISNLKLTSKVMQPENIPISNKTKTSNEGANSVKQNTILEKSNNSALDDLVAEWTDDVENITHKENLTNEENEENVTDIKSVEIVGERPENIKDSKDNIQVPNINENASFHESESASPQRRMSRIIKKKVIFDPDNPATYKLASTAVTPKTEIEKQIKPSIKKIKMDANSIHKFEGNTKQQKLTHFLKPQTKTKKTFTKPIKKKKFSEVDRLLMDEGAVNMIYQVERSQNNSEVPEISKKHKLKVKSKAAIVKKAVFNQSNTSNLENGIKLFRVRRETSRFQNSISKKLPNTSKQKNALRESVTSPPPCDEYLQDANASIIIRRHSSSSYSSSCMSPRRLSDMEVNANSTVTTSASAQTNLDEVEAPPKKKIKTVKHNTNQDVTSECTELVAKNEELSIKEKLDKKACLTLKQKLNSKLSKVLNIKKKGISKISQVPKRRKSVLNVKKKTLKRTSINQSESETNLTLEVRNCISHIVLKKDAENITLLDVKTMEDLEGALKRAEASPQSRITLLTSEAGDLCAGLDLRSLLHTNHEKRVKAATQMADAIRSLILAMESHGQVLCAGVSGACAGLGVSLLPLCDVVLASDSATFSCGARDSPGAGTAVLVAHPRAPLASFSNDMILSERKLSAAEALQRGLLSRTLWPDSFAEHLQAFLDQMVAQSPTSLNLKKRLLNLKSTVETDKTLRACLDAERDILIQFWSSPEGQISIKNSVEGKPI